MCLICFIFVNLTGSTCRRCLLFSIVTMKLRSCIFTYISHNSNSDWQWLLWMSKCLNFLCALLCVFHLERSLQFLVRVFPLLSLILCYSYFGTFLSTWSEISMHYLNIYKMFKFDMWILKMALWKVNVCEHMTKMASLESRQGTSYPFLFLFSLISYTLLCKQT